MRTPWLKVSNKMCHPIPVRKEFGFGAWDVGNFRFKGRQISQMPNGEIVFDMEQYKHELEQSEVSKADKTKP